MMNTYLTSALQRSGVLCAAGALTLISGSPAIAGPTGGEVVQGVVSIQPISNTLTNIAQASDRAVINWQDFSVDADETVNFQQPNSTSAILNRVVGSDLSVIAGQIFANGQVFLINANGIAFSGTSYVDVNGLVATTANVSDSAFMSGGQMAFDAAGQSGATINTADGAQILAGGSTAAEAGLVAMIAPGIEHSGIIQADFGQVVIGGAETFTMDLNGDGLYSFALGDAVTSASSGSVIDISSTGSIVAQGGSVLITAEVAGDIVGNAINLSGEVFARSAVTDGQGNVVLQAACGDGSAGCGDIQLTESALIDVTGDNAGGAVITGRGVGLAAGAEINASGTQNGGSISIESNGSGATDALSMAGDLFVDGDTGSAGSVTLTASNGSDLDASGGISALGSSGSGGIVFNGGSTDGAGGAAGDYSVSTIVATTGATTYDYAGDSELTIASSGTASPFIDVLSLNSALRGGTLATVNAGGDLRIGGLIDGRSDADPTAVSAGLELNSQGAVSVDGACGATSSCGVVLSDSSLSIQSGSSVIMEAAAQNQPSLLSTSDGASGTITIVASGDVTLQDVVTSGLLSINATNGDVLLARDLGGPQGVDGTALLGGIAINQDIILSEAGDVTLGGLKVGDDGVLVQWSDVLNVDGQIESAGRVNLRGITVYLRRSIFTDGASIDLGIAGFGSQILLDPTGPVFVSNPIDTGIDRNNGAGDAIDLLEPYVLPSREITLSTGTVSGTIGINAPLDIVERLRNFGLGGASLQGTDTDGDSNTPPDPPYIYPDEFDFDPTDGSFGDPTWFYVTLNLVAGNDIDIRNGIASNRPPTSFGGEGVLTSTLTSSATSANSLSLVIENGNLDLSALQPGSVFLLNSLEINPNVLVVGNLVFAENEPALDINDEFPIETIFDANPTANVFVVHREFVFLTDIFGDQPPAAPVPGTFAGGIDSGVGSNVNPPGTTPDPSGPNAGGGNPGEIGPRPGPELPTGTAPDAIDDPSRVGDSDDSGGSVVAVGGEGVGSEADMGTGSQTDGAAADVFANEHHVVGGDSCVQTDDDGVCIESSQSNEYLSQGVFEGVQSGVLR